MGDELLNPAKIFSRCPTGQLWLGPKQRHALAHLATGWPLKVLSGPTSSGKSTILHHFQHCTEGLLPLPAVGPQESSASVLMSLLTSVGLGPSNLSEIEQRNLLTVFARQRSMQGKRIVLCVDNVARFSPEAWSEIDRLRHLPLVNQDRVELVVVGTEADVSSTPLVELLHDGATSAVEAVHYVAAPSDDDVRDYVAWRFEQKKLSSPFTAEACCALNAATQGRLSSINVLCQAVLIEQRRESRDAVDAPLVERTVASLAAMRSEKDGVGPERTGDTVRIRRLVDDASRMDRLVVSSAGKVQRTVPLEGRLLIGREPGNDLQLPGRYLSRHHAAILPTAEGHYYVIDLNSANGIRVNRRRVDRGLLRDGDVVEIGQFRIRIELRERPPADVPPLPEASGETDIVPVPSYDEPLVRAAKS